MSFPRCLLPKDDGDVQPRGPSYGKPTCLVGTWDMPLR